ncbi:hypothetical protein ABW19_dt0205236 [Dactylella cylindrospora]|nr:hypothetical protein ABW19_dt0205236 [Dactylella cylindrospora]
MKFPRPASSLTALTTLSLASLSSAFYLPGVAPTDYNEGDLVSLNVNRLTPAIQGSSQQVHSLISYDYYHEYFHFCTPEGGPQKISESLGSILFGDRILTSPFELKMHKNETCKFLCKAKHDKRSAKFTNMRIWQGYNLNWLIDGLPAATLTSQVGDEQNQFYSQGFSLGGISQTKEPKPYLNNHYDIIVDYHRIPGRSNKEYRVVGVVVQPSSKHQKLSGGSPPTTDCGNDKALFLREDGDTDVIFTYSVIWMESPTAWATRWDKYLHVFDPKIHWFSLVNSAIIVIFLTGMVSMVLLKTLRKDIARYNQLDLNEDVQEDSGWKLVHGDVFRPPKNPMLLSIFLGSGAQIFFMTGITIMFALLGFLSPSGRGSLATAMIILYTLLGFVGGYVSARVYKSFGGESWKKNIVFTPIFIPGVVFGTFFFLNFFLIFKGSSGAVPLWTMVALVCIWFVISLPLSFTGSWFGFRAPAFEAPVRTNQIPRQIPEQALYLKPIPSMLLVGILPFGAIFVELYFIMSSIWFHRVYYMFGFLFVCYGIMIITCSTVTILMIYFLLCSENYHWHWRAFFISGASAFYVVLNAFIYWLSKLSLGGLASNVLYIGYSLLIGFLFFILTGTIGFFSSWYFVKKIYASIKID